MSLKNKKIRCIFIARICLWFIALSATIYWIYWSFKIYTFGVMDEHEYAVIFRPIFAKGLGISIAAICLSFILRSISDRMRQS